MKTKTRNYVMRLPMCLMLLSAATGGTMTVSAEVPLEMPDAALVGYMNGRLNVEIASNDTVAAYTTNTDYSGLAFSFQIRPKDSGDDWDDVPGAVAPYRHGIPATEELSSHARNNQRLYWSASVVIEGMYELRGRVTRDGVSSEWRTFPDFKAVRCLTGTIKDSRKSIVFTNKATDGDIGTFYEDYYTNNRWYGIVFDTPHLVTGIRLVPRAKNCRGASVEATDDDDFTVNVRTIMTFPDDESMENHMIYDFPIENGVVAKAVRLTRRSFPDPASNPLGLMEIEWVGIKMPPVVDAEMCGMDDCRARLTASVEDVAGYASVMIERAYQSDGPYETLMTVSDLSAGLCVTDEVSAVGLPCHYRLTASEDGYTVAGKPGEAFIRGRFLQADEGVENLSSGIFADPGKTIYYDKGVNNAFDGDVGTFINAWYSSSFGMVPLSIGRKFPEKARIFGAWMYSAKLNDEYQIKKVGFYAAFDESQYNGKKYIRLAEKQSVPQENAWLLYPSCDTTNYYQCAFVAGDPVETTWNYAREFRFFGVTKSDEVASGKVFAPSAVSVSGGVGNAVISWDDAINAESFSIWRREVEDGDWILAVDNLDSSTCRYTDADVEERKTYSYRIVASGLDGMMSVAVDAGTAEIAPRGFLLFFK